MNKRKNCIGNRKEVRMKGDDMLVIKGQTKQETKKQNEIILNRGVKENQKGLKNRFRREWDRATTKHNK